MSHFFWIESSPGFLGLSSTKIFFKLDRATVFFKASCCLAKLKIGNNFISLIIKVLEFSSNLTRYSTEHETYHIHINGRPLRQFSYQTQEVHTYMFQDLRWLNFQYEDERFLSFVDRSWGVRTC